MKRPLGILRVLIGLLFVGAAPVAADDTPHELMIWAGGFDTAGSASAEVGSEYRGRQLFWEIRITAGLMITEDSSGYIYGGFRRDFDIGQRWGLAIGSAAGLYEDGDGKDLGGPVEFRSNFEIYHRFGSRARLVATFYHLSSASIYTDNPGSNSMTLGYAFVPGRR